MKVRFLLPLLFLLSLQSCTEQKIFSAFETNFSKNQWKQEEVKTFEFRIEKEARFYDVALHFAYLSDFVVNSVPFVVTVIHPDGSTEKKSINIVVKDDQNKETGVCAGDYCDIRSFIFKDEALKKGVYKILIQHEFTGPYLPNVNGIGIEVLAQAD